MDIHWSFMSICGFYQRINNSSFIGNPCNAELERAFSLRLKGVKDKLCVTCTKMHCKNILKIEMSF